MSCFFEAAVLNKIFILGIEKHEKKHTVATKMLQIASCFQEFTRGFEGS